MAFLTTTHGNRQMRDHTTLRLWWTTEILFQRVKIYKTCLQAFLQYSHTYRKIIRIKNKNLPYLIPEPQMHGDIHVNTVVCAKVKHIHFSNDTRKMPTIIIHVVIGLIIEYLHTYAACPPYLIHSVDVTTVKRVVEF